MSYRDPLVNELQALENRVDALDEQAAEHWDKIAPTLTDWRVARQNPLRSERPIEMRYKRWFENKSYCWTEEKK